MCKSHPCNEYVLWGTFKSRSTWIIEQWHGPVSINHLAKMLIEKCKNTKIPNHFHAADLLQESKKEHQNISLEDKMIFYTTTQNRKQHEHRDELHDIQKTDESNG